MTYTTHTTLLSRLSDGVDPTAWKEFHDRYNDLLRGFAYRYGGEVGLVAVNQSEQPASGYLRFPKGFWQGWTRIEMHERLAEPQEVYVRESEELEAQGLYVRLEPYAFHLLTASR